MVTTRDFVGGIGNVISFCLFLAPAPTFYYKICKKGSVGEFSPNPYLATLLNCLFWVFYGLPFVHPHSILVVTINSFGIVMELGYVIIYLWYANKKQRNQVCMLLALELIIYVGVVCCILRFAHGSHLRTLIVGIICVVLNIFMYAMPLDVLKLVIRTKSVEYMPFFLLVANFLNGLCWLTYALLRFDLFITISNGTGAILGLIQLIVYAIYYKSTPKSSKDENPTNNKDNEINSTTTSETNGVGRVFLSV